ncbi:Vps52/Sac2 [Yamadazyma tenuis ATCC 10573]|uniref:Vps52/Sac2 n=1 Tax=Candida tenuis (strain ATCC 10573 / BCRC 21748 / CBS 615 / JCM 9827 / NBRC 10315 / NRRL Y-1498 / VKM Y-70) TaxID=590646 RepID=G3B708_CANTC|nr:Vps52/Sac2 [Yamadazyma tenuis ATCC 10573]EGV63067.1 Vps52/Sac2 [Yamadazyma tenuis ATCC 10573]
MAFWDIVTRLSGELSTSTANVLRAEATNNNEQVLPSRINNLSDEELLFLTSKFEEFSMEFRTFKQKLVPIEFVLENFNTELSQLSSSLVSLHQQSNQLSHNLDSQKGTIEKLNPIIVDLIIPTDMVQSILSGNVDASWIENLRFINEKLMLIKQLEEEKLEERLITLYKDSEAFKQLKEGIDILVVKATERIRDYMIIQIKHLRSSTSESSQKIQQNLLSVKEAFAFLKFHQPKLADQLQLAYFYTMRWYYGSRFSKYLYALQKLNLRHVDSTMVLGADGATGTEDKLGYIGGGLKSWIYAGGSSANSQSSPTSFQHNKVTLLEYLGSVDKRLEIINTNLEDLHKSAMPAQIAETTPFGYWVEFVFNQWFTALLDNVVVEYLFVVEFFFQGEEKYHTVEFSNPVTGEPEKKDWSLLMFDNVYKVGREFLSWLITHMPSIFSAANRASTTLNSSRMTHTFQGSCDVYALLLMIRIIQTSSIQLHNQFHIPVLEDHINSLLLILWPQFTRVIDLNCDAMKKTIIRIGGNKGNLAPSSLTQQFGQMLSGLLKLSIIDVDGTRKIETLRGEPLYTSITRLRNDFENTLTKVSNQVKNPTDKEIFLYNNYFLIVNILKNENQDTSNDFINEQIDHFEKLCKAYENS